MNGTYGGAFDLEGLYGGGANQRQTQQQQQQQRMQQSRGYLQQTGPCFEGYDPTQLATTLPQYGQQYNPTGVSAHGAFLANAPATAPLVPLGLDPIPVGNHLLHRQQASSYLAGAQTTAPTYGIPIEAIPSIPDDLISSKSAAGAAGLFTNLFPDENNSAVKQADAARKENPDAWLETLKIKCSDLSLKELTGLEVLNRVRSKTDDVVTRYLPCVEFLVACQQELRAGLAAATQQRLTNRHTYRDAMTPRQFFNRYLEPLPNRFFQRNKNLMEKKVLNDAVKEIQKLCDDSSHVQHQGCEVMKNTFLGGMKDGESWGLRKWLSRHGGALHICNDLECILRSCQALERSLETTRKIAERIRPLAGQALNRLKADVPSSYQEVSTAHPYLPFFHRLESALKGMSNFDPEDDDVICIDDDDEIEEVRQKAPPKKSSKRKGDTGEGGGAKKKAKTKPMKLVLPIGKATMSDDDDSVIEILEVKPGPATPPPADDSVDGTKQGEWKCPKCTMVHSGDVSSCYLCKAIGGDADSDDGHGFADLPSLDEAAASVGGSLWDATTDKGTTPPPNDDEDEVPLYAQMANTGQMTATELAQTIEKLAVAAAANNLNSLRPLIFTKESFWDHGPQYAAALRLLVTLLRNRDARGFLDPVDQQHLVLMGRKPYNSVIRNPLCFRDIVASLCPAEDNDQEMGKGKLPAKGLSSWNMWRGIDLLQAIDLVLLNSLAYNGKEKTAERTSTNKLRKSFWDGINGVITTHLGPESEKRRQCTPTRRGETSGFVIRK